MNIYVGNLPFSSNESDVRELFANHGNVDRVQIIMDRQTGRSRGFAFVEMNDDAQGRAAIDALNGHQLEGRAIVVNEARPRTESGAGRGPRH